MEAKYEDVYVPLVGEDGNAFAILGRAERLLVRHLRTRTAMTPQEIQAEKDAYVQEATSGDYDHLLQTTMRWFRTTADDEVL